MTSPKGKNKPSLDGLGSLDDLLLDGATSAGPGAGGLDDLLGQAEHEDPIPPIDYDNVTNEEAVAHETSAVLAAFKARAQREQERFELVTDSEYWVGLCFQSRAQKEAFLKAVNLLQAGDKYLDGRLLAKRMGIDLPAASVPFNPGGRIDAKLAAMVKEK